MATITLTNTLTNGTTADADEVMENLEDIQNECNGSLDGDNISSSAALSIASLATSGNITVTGSTTTASLVIGSGTYDKTRTIAFTAAGAIPAATNGANQNKIAGTNFEYYQLEFDKDTDESVYWIFPIPPDYDGGNVSFKIISKCETITSGTVVWVIKTISQADSATWDTALSTTITFDAKTVDGTALDKFTAQATGDPGWTAGHTTAVLKLYRDTSEDSAAEDVDVVAVNAYWEVT